MYHDQLDGEVIAYLLQARHLWDGSGVLPEFMNGAAKTALTMPAPALCAVIPVAACGTGTGLYAGGWQLCRISGNVLPAWMGRRNIGNTAEKKRTCRFHSHADRMYVCVSAVFAGVRAVPVWIAAVNVLCTAVGEKDRPKNFRILCYFYVLLFGCNSSLVLSGFAVLGIWAVWEIVTLVDKRKQFSAGRLQLGDFAAYVYR